LSPISNATLLPGQARRRKQPTLPPGPNRPIKVEHEYFREGARTYLDAWDVHRAKVFGRCEVKTGMAPVERLVSEVMNQEPYKSPRRVFWIKDNCSAHRGQEAVDRFRAKWPNAIPIHTPNDFSSLAELEQRLFAFQIHYERTASPFKWTSLAAIFTPFWPRSPPNGWLRQPNRNTSRNSERA
jgi:hypothetical protein